jgi:hypothetical protein
VKNMNGMIYKGWEKTWLLRSFNMQFQFEAIEVNVITPLFSITFNSKFKQYKKGSRWHRSRGFHPWNHAKLFECLYYWNYLIIGFFSLDLNMKNEIWHVTKSHVGQRNNHGSMSCAPRIILESWTFYTWQ